MLFIHINQFMIIICYKLLLSLARAHAKQININNVQLELLFTIARLRPRKLFLSLRKNYILLADAVALEEKIVDFPNFM